MKRLFWILFATLFASVAAAQSLAEVAAKEKDRRKKVEGQETRTITDQELRGMPHPLATSTTVTSDDEEDEDEMDDEDDEDDEDEDEPEDPKKTESYWRDRLSSVDKRIHDLESELKSPLYTANPRGGRQRKALEQKLAQAKAERRTIVDEGRRKGVPPGWLR